MKKKIAILGSTGSIGKSTLEVIKKDKSITQVISDLENINAHLYSIEALMERIFDVKVPDKVEDKFREIAGERRSTPKHGTHVGHA